MAAAFIRGRDRLFVSLLLPAAFNRGRLLLRMVSFNQVKTVSHINIVINQNLKIYHLLKNEIYHIHSLE